MLQEEGAFSMPLAYECFYKNLKTVSEQKHLPKGVVNAACALSLPLYSTHFYTHTLTSTILLPDSVGKFRCML